MPVSPGAQVTTEEVLAFLHKHHPQIVAFPSREALTAALAEGVEMAWKVHLAAMTLEYETGVEVFDKAAIPAALTAAIVANLLPEVER